MDWEEREFPEWRTERYEFVSKLPMTTSGQNKSSPKPSKTWRYSLEYRAHCELGMAYYQLQDYPQAKRELEKCAATADESYLKDGIIWKYLEAICRALKLKEQAEHYASLARPS